MTFTHLKNLSWIKVLIYLKKKKKKWPTPKLLNSIVYCNSKFFFFINTVLFINPKIFKQNISQVPPQKFEPAQRFPTLIINQHIRMISEGSCDTEDWRNNAEKAALQNFKVY